MNSYKPEGALFNTELNQKYISSFDALAEAKEKNITLEARVSLCDNSHNLIVDLPCGKGIIPRCEGAIGIEDGSTRDIAIISRVNKIVCFKVTDIKIIDGASCAFLSRKLAQEECTAYYINHLSNGDIIEAKVTHLEQFGCFVDICCGVSSLIPIDLISVSRISHPSERFRVGENIRAIVKSVENGRVFLSHKELLGTWTENASQFNTGETVSGIVRSVEEYGIFVELTPNLAGLAEPKPGISPGQQVSVFIKALIPEKMKVKLVIVDVCEENPKFQSAKYYITEPHIDKWRYTPENCQRIIETDFT